MHCSICFNKDSKYLDLKKLVDFMSTGFIPEYENMISDLLKQGIDDTKPSLVYLLVCNYPLIMQKYTDLLTSMNDSNDVRLGYMLEYSEMIEHKFGAIRNKIQNMKETCEASHNIKILGIFKKSSNEDMINELNDNDTSIDLLMKSNTQSLGNILPSQAISQKSLNSRFTRKKINRVASKNFVTQN